MYGSRSLSLGSLVSDKECSYFSKKKKNLIWFSISIFNSLDTLQRLQFLKKMTEFQIVCSTFQSCVLPLTLIQFHALKTVSILGPNQRLSCYQEVCRLLGPRAEMYQSNLSIQMMGYFRILTNTTESLSILTLRIFAKAYRLKSVYDPSFFSLIISSSYTGKHLTYKGWCVTLPPVGIPGNKTFSTELYHVALWKS